MRITIWKLLSENGEAHNHISEGWCDSPFPLPLKEEYENQKAWSRMEWSKKAGWLINGKVISFGIRKGVGFYENY